MYSSSKRFANPRSRVTEYLFGFSRLPRILMTGTSCAVYPTSRAQRQWACANRTTHFSAAMWRGGAGGGGNRGARFRPGGGGFGFLGEGGVPRNVLVPEAPSPLEPPHPRF